MIKMEKIYRFGWYALILAMTGDILVSLVLPCLYEEYSSMKMSISALGNLRSGSYNDTEQFDDITTLCFRYLGK